MSTRGPSPAAGGFTVLPARLHDTGASFESAAQALAEVGRSLMWLDVPTGRADTQDACRDLLRELSTAVGAAADDSRRAAAQLGAAGRRYSGVDAACVQVRACG